MQHALPWILFNLFVLAMLALDLSVFHRSPRAMSLREAALWWVFWGGLAAGFGFIVWHTLGQQKALEFTTGYVLESSMSIDNLFIFLLIFKFFQVPAELQHRVLFWGILGAIITRGIFIVVGVSLLERFHWIIFVFGAFLIYTGLRMIRGVSHGFQPDKNPAVKLFRRLLPVCQNFQSRKFFVKQDGKLWVTPLLLVLLVVEATDLVFATDSIPAVLAITPDPFIVYTSNVFAILGLRSIYFALIGMLRAFRFLHYGISAVLVFIGTKMLLSEYFVIPTIVALGTIAALVAISIVASAAIPENPQPTQS